MKELIAIAPFAGIALLFYFVLIRPGVRSRRELVAMQSSLEVDDEVMLTSGVYGVLRSLEEKSVDLEIADGVTIKVARGAIGQIMTEHDLPEHETDQVDESVQQPDPDEVVGVEEKN